jgi:hypothetical protein
LTCWSSSEPSEPVLAESVRKEFGLERVREKPSPARARRVRSVHAQTDHRRAAYVVAAFNEGQFLTRCNNKLEVRVPVVGARVEETDQPARVGNWDCLCRGLRQIAPKAGECEVLQQVPAASRSRGNVLDMEFLA